VAAAGLNSRPHAHGGAEDPQGFLGAVVRAAGDAGPVELEPGGPLLVTTLEDSRTVLSSGDDFEVPFDVSRGAIRRGARTDRTIPLLDPSSVATGRRVFAEQLAEAEALFAGPDLDTLSFLRDAVARSTTAALVPEAGGARRERIANQVLVWIDALAPVISAERPPRRWSTVGRTERRARHSLIDDLTALGCADAPARATALAAGIQVPIAAGAWCLTQLACRPGLQRELRDDPALALPIVWEALRLYPPSWLLPRISTREVHLGEAVVPAYRAVLVSPVLLGRLPRLVPGPDQGCAPLDELAPSRWLQGDRRPGAWLPFGAGPHACPGRNLGLAQLTHLVTWSSEFELAAPGPPAIDTSRGLSPRPSTISVGLVTRDA
jgi:hypothetical protein